MKRVLETVLFTVLILVGAVAVLAAAMLIRSKTYTVPEQAATIENDTGLVQASGRSLYDAKGNRLHLRGINAGQILLQEGWMSLSDNANPNCGSAPAMAQHPPA